ncbi:MAG: PD40 domain-containing protein, partial [Candidatus Cloacimonetes bacterium]|nr:PD40 domain-containing protein [Candidatus Cloacimonadota bacterium]
MFKRRCLILILMGGISLLSGYYFGQNKVNSRPVDWSMIETLHFDVYFPAGNDEFGRLVALMAEETYYYLKESFQFPILSRIPIIVYGSKTEFQTTNIIYPLLTEGVGGFTESLRNRVVIPFDGSFKQLEEVLTHELTHAYINAMDKGMGGSFISLRSSYFPFWFSEGLPELLSVGGKSVYNDMYILDMVVNDNIRDLEYLDGYLAYRLGESFLAYLDEVYGRDKVMDYFYALRVISNLDDATRKIFGMKFEELQSRWRFYLKREFFPMIGTHTVPQEKYEQRTNHREDGSSLNTAPRFSRDGQRLIYFSNRGGRYSIWLSTVYGLTPPTRILLGEASSNYEEFYYFRSTLSWFPDNRRIAFVSKTAEGDRINIFDVDSRRLLESIGLNQMNGIYEIDVSPCGRYIVMSAQPTMQSDLYLLDLDTRELTQLTDDSFYDYQPRFSPDGRYIAFSSERTQTADNFRKGFFSHYVSDLFLYGIDDGSIAQLTNEEYNCSSPEWTSAGDQILFVSERMGSSNFELLDLATSRTAPVSQTLAGVFTGDLSYDDK